MPAPKILEPPHVPEPNEEPRPEEQPEPIERPRRRRIMQPVFRTNRAAPPRAVRVTVVSLALVLSTLGVRGQVEPLPTPPPPDRPQQPGTPRPVATDAGWVMFNDNMGRELNIPDDQLQRLRDVNGKYQKENSALGNEPTKNPGYRSLTELRNADIKSILSPEQYDQWYRKYGAPVATPPPAKKAP